MASAVSMDPILHLLMITTILLQIRSVHGENCLPGQEDDSSCNIYIEWKGCYKATRKDLVDIYRYDKIFEDPAPPPAAKITEETWRTQMTSLACRCANSTSSMNYTFFALRFYSACYGHDQLKFDSNEASVDFCASKRHSCSTTDNRSFCFKVGTNAGVSVYKIVKQKGKLPVQTCTENEIVGINNTKTGGSNNRSPVTSFQQTSSGLTQNITNVTEDSRTSLLRIFGQFDKSVSVDQILLLIKNVVTIFRRPEMHQNFSVYTKYQEMFLKILSRVIGEEYKYLWRRSLKMQHLVVGVQEVSAILLRSMSLTNKTDFSYYASTPNIELAANVSSTGKTVLRFNDTAAGISTLKTENRDMSRKPFSSVAMLYKGINDVFPASTTGSLNMSSLYIASSVVSIVAMHDGRLIREVNGTIQFKSIGDRTSSRSKSIPVCVYWEENPNSTLRGAWSTTGVKLIDSYHGNYSTCRTEHLTNFAMLMQATNYEVLGGHEIALELITYFGCALSLLCLLVTIVTFPMLRLKAFRFKIHFHLCISLAAAQVVFLAGIAAKRHKTSCMIAAMLLHYFYTAAFMWMLAEGIHLYLKVVVAYEVKHIKERVYIIFAWGFPVVLVGIAFAAYSEGYGTSKGCWLSLEKGFRWSFITPVLVVLVVNFVILIKVITVMVKLDSNPFEKSKDGKTRIACKGLAILLPLMGLTWVFGILGVNSDTIAFQYLFSIFNSLQGAFIFCFNYIANTEVRTSFRRTIQRSQMTSL